MILKSKYQIKAKNLDKLSAEEKRRLSYLTLRPYSCMKDDVLHRKENLNEFRVFLAKFNDLIIGWAVIFPEKYSDEYFSRYSKSYRIYVYVQSAYRRTGLGTKLVNVASKWGNKNSFASKVFSHDKRSQEFFNSCKEMRLRLIHDA